MLSNLLTRLSPTGKSGFEGLIAKLLTSISGIPFHLSKSGYQAGRDLGGRSQNGNIVAVETKRYLETTPLNDRELLGEISQAIRETPDLDLWVLVASRTINLQLRDQLIDSCNRYGISFLAIAIENEHNMLETLCAFDQDIVLQFLSDQLDGAEQTQLSDYLSDIARQTSFEARCQNLKSVLSSPLIGYASWKKDNNTQFIDSLSSEAEARSAFGQLLNTGDPTVQLIERKEVWHLFESWWHDHNNKTLAVLGEEGDGKSWSVASWLSQRIMADDFPAVIFVPSVNAGGTTAKELVFEAVTKSVLDSDIKTRWRRRIDRWLDDRASQETLFLLVLDGLNENHTWSYWRAVFDDLIARQAKSTSVAAITTCRTDFWKNIVVDSGQIQVLNIPPYSDEELAEALLLYNLNRADIGSDLLPLISKPRYFDLTVKHRIVMAESGDITVARLIYEDWRDRLRRKRHLTDLTHESFQDLIRGLAAKNIETTEGIWEREIENYLPASVDMPTILRELQTSGILKGSGTRVKVDQRITVYGLGLLLVDELEHTDFEGLEEMLATFLEPHTDMDIKAEICSFAALHALLTQHINTQIAVLLLEAWVSNRNAQADMRQNFTAYLPIRTDAYTQLAERVWRSNIDNHKIQELLLSAFLRWQDNSTVYATLQKACIRWLGFLHPYGFSSQRGSDSARAENVLKRMEMILDITVEAECEIEYAGLKFTLTFDDGLLRLANFALLLISHFSRSDHFRGLITGILAEQIMGYSIRYDLNQWIFSTAKHSLWTLIDNEVDRLLPFETEVTKWTIIQLLQFEGSPKANEKRQLLAPHLPEPRSISADDDPCTSIYARPEKKTKPCLEREDIRIHMKLDAIEHEIYDPHFELPDRMAQQLRDVLASINIRKLFVSRGTSSEDLELEQHEAGFCRLIPHGYTQTIREVFQTLRDRWGESLEIAAHRLGNRSLILSDKEYAEIYAAWLRTQPTLSDLGKTNEVTEFTLFEHVLEVLDVDKQPLFMHYRHSERHDLIRFSRRIKKPTSAEKIINALLQMTDVPSIRRILFYLVDIVEVISEDELRKIAHLQKHADSLIRAIFLKLIYLASATSLITDWLDDSWSWHLDFHFQENIWGSLIISEYETSTAFEKIMVRCHPSYWGIVLASSPRDTLDSQTVVDAFTSLLEAACSAPDIPKNVPQSRVDASLAAEIDKCIIHRRGLSHESKPQRTVYFGYHNSWGGETSKDTSFLNRFQQDEDREFQEQQNAISGVIDMQHSHGNVLYTQRIIAGSLNSIVEQHPYSVTQWLLLLERQPTFQILAKGYTFFHSLCESLLEVSSPEAVPLYRKLKNSFLPFYFVDVDTRLKLLDLALFDAPVTPDIETEREALFESCRMDSMILRFCVIAQLGRNRQSVSDTIHRKVETDSPHQFALAITQLGFFVEQAAYDALILLSANEPEDTWRGVAIQKAIQAWEVDRDAKHWFERYWQEENKEIAWATFRLFLHRVDRRFWVWQSEIMEIVSNYPWYQERLRFFKCSRSQISNQIVKNESKHFGKTLFGQKTNYRQTWPWL